MTEAAISFEGRTYVVTGGGGFIGTALVKRLSRLGARVRAVDNNLRGDTSRLASVASEIEIATADVRDVDRMTEICRGADSVLHLAALNGTENFYKRPQLVLDVGVRGMLAVLDAARAADVPEFVLASSSEAYQKPPTIPTPEDAPLSIPDPWNPRFSYGGSKLISEIILANYHQDHFERVMSFRPHNVYGPDMGWEHVIPQFIRRAETQIAATPSGLVPFEIQGDGTQTRAFIHIDDFVDGLLLLLARGAHRTTYHLGSEDETAVSDLVSTLFAQLGRTPDIISTLAPAGSVNRRCADISRMKALGFAPKIDLASGLVDTVAWYRKALQDGRAPT